MPQLSQLVPSWRYPVAWATALVILLTPFTAGAQLFQFHVAHMWLHANATLYRLVHKVHHLARYPIPSDSGTESPLEFMLSEVTLLSCAVPLALWLPGEAMAMRWQRAGHTFELGNEQLRAAADSDPAKTLGDGPGFHMLHHAKNVSSLCLKRAPLHQRQRMLQVAPSLGQPQPASASLGQPRPASASLGQSVRHEWPACGTL